MVIKAIKFNMFIREFLGLLEVTRIRGNKAMRVATLIRLIRVIRVFRLLG
jgi:hypothetical protein